VASRREARRRAIEVLYQADITGADPRVVLEEWRTAGREIDPFADLLVAGVAEHAGEVDAVLAAHSEHWSVDRMASVDRVVLRLAIYELRFGDVPPAVAIDEAVRAAKELSTDDSGAFVNGVLGTVAAERER
jgi:transcription antitermination protein NusB